MLSTSKTLRSLAWSSTFARSFFSVLVLIGCSLASTASVRAGYLYVLNDDLNVNQIYGYNVNESTGALTLLPGFPLNTGGAGYGPQFFGSELLTIDRVNRRLYVLNGVSGTISMYSINPANGALTALPYSPFALSFGPVWETIAVHPSGSPFIIGAEFGGIASYNITATAVAPAPGSPFPNGAFALSSVFSRDGNYAYTGGDGGVTFEGFGVNAANGILTTLPGSPFNSGSNAPLAYSTDSQGRFFVASRPDQQLRIFTTVGGVPTAVTGNPFSSGLTSAFDGALSPAENFYYVADRTGNRVGAYQIAGSGAATTLTAVADSPFASSGNLTDALVFNNNGTFLFAANGNSRNITTYTVDPTTGVLTFGNVQPANTLGMSGRLSGIDYLPTTITVTNTNDNGAGSLRQAIFDANATGGAIIIFSSLFDTLQVISLSSGQLSITSNVTIVGPGANLLTVQNTAAASSTSRVFNNTSGAVNLSGMAITGGNVTGSGGGIFHSGSNALSLTNCIVAGNTASNGGGGIYNSATLAATLNVNNSTISGNISNSGGPGGGGIDSTGTLNLTNSTVSTNTKNNGTNNGGGIYVFAGNATITNSTITNNSAGSAGAGGVFRNNSPVVTVRNSIIAANQNNATIPDVAAASGVFTSSGFNLIGNVGTATGFNQTGDQTGTGANPVNPLLDALAFNGGTTPTHALKPNSPAVDKGNSFNLSNDQRVSTRLVDNAAIPNTGDGSDIGAFERQAVKYDFDGDGKSDISVFRPANPTSTWYLLNSSTGFSGVPFGNATDKIVPADYDGDGRSDPAVYRNGQWYLQRSSMGFTGVAFGNATDIPMPADFDGDGKAELTVFRPSTGTWYVLNLVNNQSSFTQFGQSGDVPVAADYDGDGRADYAIYRPANGVWFILRSTQGFVGIQFGNSTDKPVVGDYDGDGKADEAVYRPSTGTWYLLRSTSGFAGGQFGNSTDLPVPADYDGDGKTDLAVFRDGTWYLLKTTEGFAATPFGALNDKPIPNAFVP